MGSNEWNACSQCTLWILRVRCKIHPFKGEMQNPRSRERVLLQALATWISLHASDFIVTNLHCILWYLYWIYQVAWCKMCCFSSQYLEFASTLIFCNCVFSSFQISIKWPNKRIFGEPKTIKKKHHLQFAYSYLLKVPHNPHHITTLNHYACNSLELFNVFFDTRFHSLNRLTFPYCLRLLFCFSLPCCSKLKIQLKLNHACLKKLSQ